MKNIYSFVITILLLNTSFLLAQDIKKIPDSLKIYSYEELRGKIFKNSSNNFKKNYIYSRAYLLKGKNEKNVKEVVYGYDLESEISEDLNKSLKYSDSAIIFAQKKFPRAISYLYYNRGNLFYNKKKLKESLNCFLLARKDSTNNTESLQNKINYSIGLIKKTQGNYQEAIDIYKKCEEKARLNNQSNYLIYLFGIAELYNRIDKIELSEKYTSKGILLKSKDELGNYYYPYFVSNRGKNNFKKGKYEIAINDLSNPLNIIKNENQDFSNYAENCFYLGECYYKLNKEDKALIYYKKVDSVFVVRKDISLLTISAYNHIIDYYKKRNDYKNIVFYSDQFIKADKILDDNYKYITSKIAKTYDIQKVISSNQLMISSLNNYKINSTLINIFLFFGITILGYIYYLSNKRKNNEIIKQRTLFEEYRLERENKQLKQAVIDSEEASHIPYKKTSLSHIDEVVINQILNNLKQFEEERWYLKKEYTIELLAGDFKTNSNYLSKVINEIKDCNFTQYINSLRIEYVLEQLETNKKIRHFTIQALSDFAGYNSVQTFTRAFTIQTKMKPSNFLKELRNR